MKKKNPKIIIIDDEIAYRQIIKKVAKNKFNATVLEASNPKEGFEILEKEENPDLIFLDMQMPMMDGLTMLKYIRKVPKTRDIPVIFCTALSTAELLTDVAKHNITDFIVKPIDINVLTNKLKNLFELTEE